MNVFKVILINTLIFILAFFSARFYINSIIKYAKKKKIIRKNINSKGVIDWLFYNSYKAYLPKLLIVWYYLQILLYILSIILVVIFAIFEAQEKVIDYVLNRFIWAMLLPNLVVYYIYKNPKTPTGWDFSKSFHKQK